MSGWATDAVLQLARVEHEHFDDPVAAYKRIGSGYAELSQRRERYLRGIEGRILERIPPGSRAMLDVGAGDGSRAERIAAAGGIPRVLMVEPAGGMLGPAAVGREVWQVRAEDLNALSIPERFDVITCLWNVLGHIRGEEGRRQALRNIAQLLKVDGKFFIAVNHRYNCRAYGILPTAVRWFRDQILPSDRNGDVTAKWQIGDSEISTYGHVFTHREMMRLAASAGLDLEERIVIDYESGRIRRWACEGNLFYVFRCSSRMEYSSAPQTS